MNYALVYFIFFHACFVVIVDAIRKWLAKNDTMDHKKHGKNKSENASVEGNEISLANLTLNADVQMKEVLTEECESDEISALPRVRSLKAATSTTSVTYDPLKSHINEKTFSMFIQSSLMDNVICDVPGIGPQNAILLANVKDFEFPPIVTPQQLIGVFLLLRGENISVQDHCDAFFRFLGKAGVKSHRNTIVKAIAEKCNVYFPGIYEEDDDEE